MDDLISRQALIERINNAEENFKTDHMNDLEDGDDVCDGVLSGVFNIREMVHQDLTVNPKEGKWIHWTDDYKDYCTCSCCEYGSEGEVLLSEKTPYCPICGAKMEDEYG